MHYKIIDVPTGSDTLLEQMGTKSKFWFNDNQLLFKQGRENTGENWAEKVAHELCKKLGIPSATYDFGVHQERNGVVSKTIVPRGGRLALGNELLKKVYERYGHDTEDTNKDHCIRTVTAYFKSAPHILPPLTWTDKPSIHTAAEVFAGYLMLDTLISNQDRHHENWGIIILEDQIYLAETFDHASSLGRHEQDQRRKDILEGKGRASIATYVAKAKSLFFTPDKLQRVRTIDAFYDYGKHCKNATLGWLNQLKRLDEDMIRSIFNQIPPDLITPIAIEFGVQVVLENKTRLLVRMDELR
ncbi:HipA domain-containing protein [Maridesulfovibrio frigidus]|uniref:hypothetical protein n=1 Tax=Maridesulfovibrio frigidus TaxID=340956 RepID=UPI0004E24B59|nr:hypothetical protein [Maridesulfovibrio frigidus]